MKSRLLAYLVAIPLFGWLAWQGGERVLQIVTRQPVSEHAGMAVPAAGAPLRAGEQGAAEPVLPALDEATADALLYRIAFPLPAQGEIEVAGEFLAGAGDAGLDGRSTGDIRVIDLRFRDAAGRELSYRKAGSRYLLQPGTSGRVRFSYRAALGAKGRHGRQGNFDAHFASFDGRVFLVPLERRALRTVQVAFELPDASRHRVVTPWRATTRENVYRVEEYGKPELLFLSLKKSAIAMGPFEVDRRRFGRTDAGVYAFGGWPAGFRNELRDNSFLIVDYFHRQFGFEIDGPLQIVWTPAASDGQRVYGGVWVGGMAFEMRPLSVPAQRRNFELQAHRIAHSMNREPPYGVVPLEPDEQFWKEGWASYIELVAIRRIPRYADHDGWDALYRRYLEALEERPGLDHRLAQEGSVGSKGPRAVQLLHYLKAPLAVRLLAEEIRRHGKDGMSLEAFWSDVYRSHRGTGRAVPLRQELERITGIDAQRFWCRVIESQDVILPEWRLEAVQGSGASLDAARAESACRRAAGDAASMPECRDLLDRALRRRPDLARVLDELPDSVITLQLQVEKNTPPDRCAVKPEAG